MIEIFKRIALVGDVWVLWGLVAASIASLGVIVERWRVFQSEASDFPALFDALSRRLDGGDLAGARQAAHASTGLEARVAIAGLEAIGKGPASVQEAMTSALILERGRLEKNLIALGTLGNNAPFVGLFGTVLGVIKAFNDLATTGGTGAAAVMAGISSALVATAFGILVAIPAVAANNAFQSRLKRKCANAQSLIHFLLAFLRDESSNRRARTADERVRL
ncbi:MAG: MotA/TolQ/ExbB proton channel family protein [Elusimicrobia bacterium]|nr:MotA/TolQ/ExbB proton channel family protein [Elusimicrobiota bacterium]